VGFFEEVMEVLVCISVGAEFMALGSSLRYGSFAVSLLFSDIVETDQLNIQQSASDILMAPDICKTSCIFQASSPLLRLLAGTTIQKALLPKESTTIGLDLVQQTNKG